MAGLSTVYAPTLLDYAFPTSGAGDYIAYSANGTSETASLARTAVGATGWAAATGADPSVKANSALLTSAAASGAFTVTHFAIFSASTEGVQKTDWQAVGSPRALAIGDKTEWAIGAIQITLT